MTNTENPTTVLSVLVLHGFSSFEAARAENVAFICTSCGSIAAVTPAGESTRENQRDLIAWECCGDEFVRTI